MLNKLAYVGMCISDLGKALMHDFHYNYRYAWKDMHVNKAKLLFTDSGSLTYQIERNDVF